MADYVTPEHVGDFAQEWAVLDSTNQALMVTAASRLFDNLCNVDEDFFAPASGSFSERVYYGDGTAFLLIDPFTELNSVNPVVIDPDPDVNYTLPAYSVINRTLVVLDRTKLQSDTSASFPNRFTGWRKSVKVTVSAKWGWTATPADVQLAVIHLAIYLWRTADPAFAVISNVESTAAKTVTLPEIAQTAIDNYKRQYSQAALFA